MATDALVSIKGAMTLTLNMSIIMRGFTAISPVRLAVPPLLMRQPRPSEEVMGCKSRTLDVLYKSATQEEIQMANLYVLDEILEALFIVSNVELLDQDGVGMLVTEPQQVGGTVGIPAEERTDKL